MITLVDSIEERTDRKSKKGKIKSSVKKLIQTFSWGQGGDSFKQSPLFEYVKVRLVEIYSYDPTDKYI